MPTCIRSGDSLYTVNVAYTTCVDQWWKRKNFSSLLDKISVYAPFDKRWELNLVHV